MTDPVVTVRGQAELTCPPDLVSVWASVRAQAKTAAEVQSVLVQGSTALAEVVRQLGDAVDSSSTSGLQVAPVFARRNRLTVVGYQGAVTTTVVLGRVEALGEAVEALLSVPDVELGGPSWSLRPGHPVVGEARLAAIAEGRGRAADYAAAFDATLTGLLEVSDLDGGGWYAQPGTPVALSARMVGSEAAPEFDLTPQRQHVTASVTLRFTISDPTMDPRGAA